MRVWDTEDKPRCALPAACDRIVESCRSGNAGSATRGETICGAMRKIRGGSRGRGVTACGGERHAAQHSPSRKAGEIPTSCRMRGGGQHHGEMENLDRFPDAGPSSVFWVSGVPALSRAEPYSNHARQPADVLRARRILSHGGQCSALRAGLRSRARKNPIRPRVRLRRQHQPRQPRGGTFAACCSAPRR